jgi:hypothetical protein
MSKLKEHLNEKMINPNVISGANMQAMEDGYYGAYDGVTKLVDAIELYYQLGGEGLDSERKLWKQIQSLVDKSKLGKEL